MTAAFRGARVRRRPFAYDMVAGSGTYRFMLAKRNGPADDGPLVGKTLPSLGSDQEGGGFEYSTQNPYIERTHSWDALYLGFGAQWQEAGDSSGARYHYALGVDASIHRQLQLGPKVTSVTPTPTVDSTYGIVDFWEMASGGTTKLFAINGRYVLVRAGDTAADWTVSKDLGATNVAVDAIVVQQQGSGTTRYGLVALTNTSGTEQLFFSYTGASDTTVWAQHATLKARAWAVVTISGTQWLFRANGVNQLARIDLANDPLTAASWSAENQYVVGDPSSAIVRLLPHPDGTLFIFKTDGVYVLLEDGSVKRLYGAIGGARSTDNGRYNWTYENWIHTTYDGRHLRISPGGGIKPIGPERFVQNKSVVKGRITAGAETPFGAYAGILNPDTSNSYLLKFGAWREDPDADPERVEAWNGSLTTAFASKTLTAMRTSTIGAASGHQRLYMGFSDGSISYFLLPCTPNPANCTSYVYTPASTETNSIVLSRWHGGYPSDNKVPHAFIGTGDNLSSNKYAQPYFSLGGGASATQGIGRIDTTPGERQEFTEGTDGSPWIETQVYLRSATADASPVFDGLAMTYHLLRPLQLVYEFDVLVADGLRRNDGVAFRVGAVKLRSDLRELWLYGSIVVDFEDETDVTLAFRDYEERMSWDPRTQRWSAAVRVRAVSVKRVPATIASSSQALGG